MLVFFQKLILISAIMASQVLTIPSLSACTCDDHVVLCEMHTVSQTENTMCHCCHEDTSTILIQETASKHDTNCLASSCHAHPVHAIPMTGVQQIRESSLSMLNPVSVMIRQGVVPLHVPLPARMTTSDNSPIHTIISTSVLIV